jgi:hypothetical protein
VKGRIAAVLFKAAPQQCNKGRGRKPAKEQKVRKKNVGFNLLAFSLI